MHKNLSTIVNGRGLLTAILLVGGALISGIGLQIRSALPPVGQPDTRWVIISGVSLVCSGLIVYWNHGVYEWLKAKIRKATDWFCIADWQLLLLILSPLFIFLASVGAGPERRMYSPAFAMISWLLGIALTSIGGYRFGEQKPKLSTWTPLLTILVFLFAFWLRGTETATIPIIFAGDEGSAGGNASQFVTGGWNNIFITGWFSFPTLFYFIQSISIRIFGQTIEALRILSAIGGALTVAAVYLCGKVMFGHRAGILAALSLSALHFHIHFSRVGLNNIWDGLWFTVFIGALWYGWERNSRIAYLIAGLALGISQYFYVSSRVLFGVVIVGVMIALCVRRTRLYQALPNLILMFAVAIAVLFPLIRFYIQSPNEYLAPIWRASFFRESFTWKFVIQHIWVGMTAFTYTPLLGWYTPGTPILLPINAVFFYIGLISLLLQYRDSRLVLMLLWLLTLALIGGLSESTPTSQRYIAAAPACALVVGLGICQAAEVFERRWQKYSKVVTGLSYMMIAVAMINDLYFYFVDFQYMNAISNVASQGMIAQQLGHRLRSEPEGTQVAFLGADGWGYYSIPSTQYLAPQIKGIDITPSWKSFDKTRLSSEHLVFVFLPERQQEINMIRAEYPGGSLDSEKAWNNQILFWTYEYTSN